MVRIAIDERIQDTTLDDLRRNLYRSREAQAYERGMREGYDKGYADGDQEGYNRAVKSFLDLALDFAKGNRS